MAVHRLSVIIRNPSNDDEFLLVKQIRPPKFGDEEYDSFVDSDLWDLPSALLSPLDGESGSQTVVEGEELCLEKLNLSKFDVGTAVSEVLTQVGGLGIPSGVPWRFWKCVEEPEFGPGVPVHTVYVVGKCEHGDGISKELCNWMSIQSCLGWLLEIKPNSDRVGPLVVAGLLSDLTQSKMWKIPTTLRTQEYPPGLVLVPMKSRTAKPFRTTNLVVFAPKNSHGNCSDNNFIAYGDALIIDPGCQAEFHQELQEIVAALPRKLVVFVTHHHRDHVDGLSAVQKGNPDASILAHENTIRRIRKDECTLAYTPVSGDEEICINGQRLRVIYAPGHTDDHMALLHVSTRSLVAGDHCVGQGSAFLDQTSGGNMGEYFKTTYKFMDLSPHSLIPMHGRVNLWPKHMLCGYLKNRRSRETSILKAIDDGCKTLFDIVAYTYSDVDHIFWIPASSNVQLHVEHLAQKKELPKGFSLENFNHSCAEFAGKLGKI